MHDIPRHPVWGLWTVATLVCAMNQSLDGYIDHMGLPPNPTLFRHFIDKTRDQAGCIYGRRMYDIMRYWDEDQPDWNADAHDYASAWRKQPKWVVSRSLAPVGPHATLVTGDVAAALREVKATLVGEISVGGPDLAQSLTRLRLIDMYQLYVHPIVLGGGKPFFGRAPPPLRLVGSDRIGQDVIRLTYEPCRP